LLIFAGKLLITTRAVFSAVVQMSWQLAATFASMHGWICV
jgi:hypothetical protein